MGGEKGDRWWTGAEGTRAGLLGLLIPRFVVRSPVPLTLMVTHSVRSSPEFELLLFFVVYMWKYWSCFPTGMLG